MDKMPGPGYIEFSPLGLGKLVIKSQEVRRLTKDFNSENESLLERKYYTLWNFVMSLHTVEARAVIQKVLDMKDSKGG